MNKTKTTEDPRAYVRELVEWEDVNSYVATDYVEEWCNCRETTITKEGDIWIKDPGAGSWLTDDQLRAFVDWCRSMFGDG